MVPSAKHFGTNSNLTLIATVCLLAEEIWEITSMRKNDNVPVFATQRERP
jgi:hypothetical protein